MLAVFTIVSPAAEYGWLAGRTLGLGGLSVVMFGAFIARQLAARNPLMPVRILRSRAVAGANLVQVLGTAGMFGTFFLGSLYLQRLLGYNSLEIGLAFLPVAVVMGTLSVRYSERLVLRFGARGNDAAWAGADRRGARAVRPGAGPWQLPDGVFPVTVLVGAGAGLAFPALMTLAMSAVSGTVIRESSAACRSGWPEPAWDR